MELAQKGYPGVPRTGQLQFPTPLSKRNGFKCAFIQKVNIFNQYIVIVEKLLAWNTCTCACEMHDV